MFRLSPKHGLLNENMKRRWRRIRYRFEWLGLVLLTRLLPLLPRRAVVWLAHGVAWVAFRFDRRGRGFALSNLEAVFGNHYSASERWDIARLSYHHFARTMFDLFWSSALTQENYARYIEIENPEVLQQLRAKGESAVVVCIHHGHFEWASLAAGFQGVRGKIVTETFKNKQVATFFRKCREVSGHQIIPQESSMIRMLKHVRRGGVAGMLADLNLRPSDAATVIDTFGMKMCVTFLHAVLAQRGGAKLIPAEGMALPNGKCRVKFHPALKIAPDASLQQISQQCWDFFEPTIRGNPAHWLWAYKHWRFKPRGLVGKYPSYSQECIEFDRLLERINSRDSISRAA